MTTDKDPVGSINGNRLFTPKPTYYLDPIDGLEKVKEWKGAYTMADDKQNAVPNVSPTGTPVLNQTVVLILTILAAVAGVLIAIPGLPPVVTSIAGVVLAITAAFGIASPGLRKK